MRSIVRLFLLGCFLCFLSAAAWAQERPEDVFDKLISNYYSNPQPSKVPAALEGFLSSNYFKSGQISKNNSDYISAYSFGRIAQLEPSLTAKYEDLFDKSNHQGRLFILKIFQVCGNDQTKDFLNVRLKDKNFVEEKEDISKVLSEGIPIAYSPLRKQVSGPNDLDFLWVDFLITGNEEAIQKIIAVLAWPDKAREKLQDYLRSSVTVDKKNEIIKIMREQLGVRCDSALQTIESKDDIDIAIASHLMGQKTPSRFFQRIKEALKLDDNEIYYMATKGAANWSLNSNARQHKEVFEICDRAIAKNDAQAKIRLLKISIDVYLSMNDRSNAADKLEQLILLNPVDDSAHFMLGSIYVETNDIENAKKEQGVLLSLDSNLANDLDKEIGFAVLDSLEAKDISYDDKQADYSEFVKTCILKSGKIKSYESKFYIKDYTNDKLKLKGFINIEWNFEYEMPDKFSVEQISWSENVADKWITVGNKHYFKIGGWFEEPLEVGKGWDRNKTNEFLAVEKYVRIMKDNSLKSAIAYKEGSNEFVILKYDLEPSQQSQFNAPKGSVPSELELWMDKSDNLIHKASLKIKGINDKKQKIDTEYEQLFINYDKAINIEKPKEVLNLGDFKKQK